MSKKITNLTRPEVIELVKKYFDIRELVCQHTYNRFGNLSWQFIDREILDTIHLLRTEILKKGMVCNNYHTGGPYSQRGLRCNICQIPSDSTKAGKIYLSAHCNGSGFDFTIMGMTAEEARKLIEKHADLLPHPVRLEDDVTWLHIDCYNPMNGRKVTRFKA